MPRLAEILQSAKIPLIITKKCIYKNDYNISYNYYDHHIQKKVNSEKNQSLIGGIQPAFKK